MIPIPILGLTDPVSSCSHLLAAFVALIGSRFLCLKGRGNRARMAALLIFSFSLTFLFTMSGLFHWLDRGGVPRAILQRLDHAGIWLLIAGTFTPVQVILFRGPWRWSMLIFVWLIVVVGLTLEIVYFTSFPEWILVCVFGVLGWLAAFSGFQFTRSFKGASIRLLWIGGLFYSIGGVIELLSWPVIIKGFLGPHELLHFFVIMGAAIHWVFIYQWSHHPIGNDIVFYVQTFPNGKVIATAVDESLDIEADSVDDLKRIVGDRVVEKFHSSLRPKIHLRYFVEETL